MNEQEAARFIEEEIMGYWPDDQRPPPNSKQMGLWLDHLADMDYDLAVAAAKSLAGSRRFPNRPQVGELREEYLACCEGEQRGWEVFWHLLVLCFPEPVRYEGVAPDTQLESPQTAQIRKGLLEMPWGRLAWDVASNLGRGFIADLDLNTSQARFRDAFEKARGAKRDGMLRLEMTGGRGLEPATNVARQLAAVKNRAQLRSVN